MVCTESRANAAFAFALLAELLLIVLLVLLVLRASRIARIPRALVGYVIIFSTPVFLLFGIISLGALGDCIDIITAEGASNRAVFAFEWGIFNILFSVFLGLVVAAALIGKKEGLSWAEDDRPAPKDATIPAPPQYMPQSPPVPPQYTSHPAVPTPAQYAAPAPGQYAPPPAPGS